jgi:GT2 family glycosyltransferase
MKILAIFTCFNRKEKTEHSIRSLVSGNPVCRFTFVIVDDNSTDGTWEMLDALSNDYDIYFLKGTGSLFYSGGMRMGMEYARKELQEDFDYLLMMNDDVSFNDGCIKKMIEHCNAQGKAVIVGATCDSNGKLSYGAIKYTKGIKYRKLDLSEWELPADTFNANCVLIPYEAFKKVGAIDSHYIHSLGDFDYGLELQRNGYKIYSSKEFIGICNNNSSKNTWLDTSLNRRERLRKKESVKGAPIRQWFYFLKKNFGMAKAILYCVTPYVRIVTKR